MNCVECGKKVKPPMKKYCSKECASKHRKKVQVRQFHGVCRGCGREFISAKKDQRYCSQECVRRDTPRRMREYRETHKEGAENLKPREITQTTVYLVHKYAAEGMPAGATAQTLDRCMDDVGKALAQPITRGQAEAIREYFVRYRPRKDK